MRGKYVGVSVAPSGGGGASSGMEIMTLLGLMLLGGWRLNRRRDK